MGRSAPASTPVYQRRGFVLGIWFFLLAVGSVGTTLLYWRSGIGIEPAPVQSATEARLRLRFAQEMLDARLIQAEQLASLLLSQLDERSAAKQLQSALQALNPAQIDSLGISAVSYWPSSKRQQPLYMSWNATRWVSEEARALPDTDVIQREPWHALSSTIGLQTQCIWSGLELEPLSREQVVSCSRVLRDKEGQTSAVARLSFRASALLNTSFQHFTLSPVLIMDAGTRIMASSDARFSEARNIADVAKIDPELGAISVALFRAQEEALGHLANRRDFPQSAVATLVRLSAVQGESAARQLVAMHFGQQLTRHGASEKQSCIGGWCANAQDLGMAPWKIVQFLPAQPGLLAYASKLALGMLPSLLLLLLAFFVTQKTVLVPLRNLTRSLREPGSLDPKYLARTDEFGQIIRVLDSNAAELQSMRQRLGLFKPEQAAVMSQPHSAVSKLPTPVVLVDPDGKILEISPSAHRLLGHAPGDMSDRLKLRSPAGDIYSLQQLPADLRRQKYSMIEMGGTDRGFLLSTARYHRNLLVSIETAVTSAAATAQQPATAENAGVASSPALSPRQRIRLALSQLEEPATWLALQAEPEVTTQELVAAGGAQELADQIADRIDDRLQKGEEVIVCWRNIYLVHSATGLSGIRIEEIGEALKSALIFSGGERIRLSVRLRKLDMQPGQRGEDLEATIQAAFESEKSLGDQQKGPPRRTVTRNIEALVQQGFAAYRFQLITERGDTPNTPQTDVEVFRVLPHLEDADGFWLDRQVFLPTVNRQGRRADLDIWLCSEVRNALQKLNLEKSVLVFLPISAASLVAGDNQLAETLAEWTTSPEFSKVKIVITIMATEIQESNADVGMLKPICAGLGCQLAIEECSLHSHSLMMLDRAQPDFVIPQAELQRAAATNSSLAIGMESLLRVAARHKSKAVFTEVDSSDGLRLAAKLRIDLIFGTAIAPPSPMLFGNVA